MNHENTVQRSNAEPNMLPPGSYSFQLDTSRVCPEAVPFNCVCSKALHCWCHGTWHFATHD